MILYDFNTKYPKQKLYFRISLWIWAVVMLLIIILRPSVGILDKNPLLLWTFRFIFWNGLFAFISMFAPFGYKKGK